MQLRIWIAAGIALVVLAIGVAANTTSSRTSLYSQLQRPATFARATATFASDRAGVPNRLALRLPLDGARVAVSFSMPSMNMWNGFTGTLTQTGRGTYAMTVPVLGMPGTWLIQFHVAPRAGRPFTVTVDKQLR